MADDPSQTQLNYEDWFKGQSRETKLDILGPSRFKEYLAGKKITSFAKDGRVKSLKELGIDRATRKELFEEAVNAPEQNEDNSLIGTEINKPLTEEQKTEYRDYLSSQKNELSGVDNINFQEWTDTITGRIEKLPPKLQQIIFNQRTTITNRNNNKKYDAYYDSVNSVIHMESKWFRGGNEAADVFFHEMGHAIDHRYSKSNKWPSGNLDFHSDYGAFYARTKELGKDDPEEIYKILRGYSRGDVSDMFFLLSNGKYRGDYTHDLEDYKSKEAIQLEGFAHIVAFFQSKQRTSLKDFFPKAYKEFLDWLEKVDIVDF